MAPKADIYAVKVLDRNQKGYYDDIVKGIQWCIDNNIDIILMSLGGSKYSKLLDNSIQKASKYGITIVSAVGNDGISNKDTVTYPAKLSGVIGVGAINQKEKRWFKSSRGKGIDIMVPGENISSTGLNNKIITQSGTSASAAYVAGFIALMKQHKNMTNLEIENALKETATSIGNEYEYGAGIINEEKSLNYKENKSFFNKLLDSLTSFFS
ncbi:S8 family serine peptidase [Bacillus bingmayongensis]|uniref:S8 family serine peptidase n=1 Tax=Bacillus bingmayongensis TaxID=1150157 RepID=UPI0009DB4C23|nr:S8 family serine peptidase [Bacillus bingmayongensis]